MDLVQTNAPTLSHVKMDLVTNDLAKKNTKLINKNLG